MVQQLDASGEARAVRGAGIQASGWEAVHKFPKKGSRAARSCEGVRFICESHVFDDPNHDGFIMPLAEWNRYRHYTYKENRDAELVYIRAPTLADAAADAGRRWPTTRAQAAADLLRVHPRVQGHAHEAVQGRRPAEDRAQCEVRSSSSLLSNGSDSACHVSRQ